MSQPLPKPFKDLPRISSNEPSGYSRFATSHIEAAGIRVQVGTLEESDGEIQTYGLPTGKLRFSEIVNTKDKSFNSEEVLIEGPSGWPRYTYTSDSKGIRYTLQKQQGDAALVVGPSQFIAGLNSVVGPYDSAYVSKLELALNERKGNNKDTLSLSGDRPTRVQITLDGKALAMEERKYGADAKVIAAFLKGDKVVSDKLPSFSEANKQMRWMGNDWDANLEGILKKAMPKEDIAALRQSMKTGRVQVEVAEVSGDAVSRAIVGKPKNGTPDACKATR
jgi:hypothetical protein